MELLQDLVVLLYTRQENWEAISLMPYTLAWKKLAILLLLLIVTGYIYVSRHASVAQQVPLENNYLFSTKNNDIAIYVPTAYLSRYQYYDAGKGHDTILIKMT